MGNICETASQRRAREVAAELDTAAARKAEENLAAAKAWIKDIEQGGNAYTVFAQAPAEVRAQKAVVLAAVSKDGRALALASADLKDDKEVVQSAVRNHKHALSFASAKLRGDKQVVLEAVRSDGRALGRAHAFAGDKEVALAAVNQDGNALEFVAEGLRDDKDVVHAAVRKHGPALMYASEKLRGDKDIVLKAMAREKDLEYCDVKPEVHAEVAGLNDGQKKAELAKLKQKESAKAAAASAAAASANVGFMAAAPMSLMAAQVVTEEDVHLKIHYIDPNPALKFAKNNLSIECSGEDGIVHCWVNVDQNVASMNLGALMAIVRNRSPPGPNETYVPVVGGRTYRDSTIPLKKVLPKIVLAYP